MSKERPMKVSRREFVKGAALGGAALTGIGALAGCAPVAAPVSNLPEKWDEEADIVVLGYGGAGGTAAIVAHDSGAQVLMVEKTDVSGGTTAISGGAVWIPNNSLAKAAGVQDSRDDALTYMRLIAQGQADDELIVTYVDRSVEMLDYMSANTPFGLDFVLPLPDYHPEWPGGREAGRTLTAKAFGDQTGGAALMAALRAAMEERGIKSLFGTRALRLVTDAGGRVVGVRAEQGGEELVIKARKAVILACGGFEWDDELKRHLLRGPTGPSANVPDANTGDGLRMALAVGCDVRNLNECWGVPVYVNPDIKAGIPDWAFERGKPGTIMVNKYGRRFCNEAADYDTTWRSFFTWENFGETGYPNVPAYLIVDNVHRTRYSLAGIAPGEDVPDWLFRSDTIRGVADHFGIDGATLAATIDEFNKNARELKDPDYHRGESVFDTNWAGFDFTGQYGLSGAAACLAPVEEPPYYALEVWPGDIGTCGGPRVNAEAQVLTPFGEVIPGLYAAGNVAGIGGPGASYTGAGGTIGPAMTFGYIAALDAVELTAWE